MHFAFQRSQTSVEVVDCGNASRYFSVDSVLQRIVCIRAGGYFFSQLLNDGLRVVRLTVFVQRVGSAEHVLRDLLDVQSLGDVSRTVYELLVARERFSDRVQVEALRVLEVDSRCVFYGVSDLGTACILRVERQDVVGSRTSQLTVYLFASYADKRLAGYSITEYNAVLAVLDDCTTLSIRRCWRRGDFCRYRYAGGTSTNGFAVDLNEVNNGAACQDRGSTSGPIDIQLRFGDACTSGDVLVSNRTRLNLPCRSLVQHFTSPLMGDTGRLALCIRQCHF
ncbi:hypothetical protein D3C76_882630 [compost metagenome]